jgi:hypothetical protein
MLRGTEPEGHGRGGVTDFEGSGYADLTQGKSGTQVLTSIAVKSSPFTSARAGKSAGLTLVFARYYSVPGYLCTLPLGLVLFL